MLRVHQHPKAWENVRAEDGAKRYALKYALKTKQKAVPPDYQDVGRFWGCSRKLTQEANEIEWWTEASEFDVRLYAAAIGREDISEWNDLPKYIFVSGGDETEES